MWQIIALSLASFVHSGQTPDTRQPIVVKGEDCFIAIGQDDVIRGEDINEVSMRLTSFAEGEMVTLVYLPAEQNAAIDGAVSAWFGGSHHGVVAGSDIDTLPIAVEMKAGGLNSHCAERFYDVTQECVQEFIDGGFVLCQQYINPQKRAKCWAAHIEMYWHCCCEACETYKRCVEEDDDDWNGAILNWCSEVPPCKN